VCVSKNVNALSENEVRGIFKTAPAALNQDAPALRIGFLFRFVDEARL